MCKYTYTLCRKGDPDCECRYFIDEPQYCDAVLQKQQSHSSSSLKITSSLFSFFFGGGSKTTTKKKLSERRPPQAPPWIPLLSMTHSRIGLCDVVMEVVAEGEFIHFQAEEFFKPVVRCQDVELLEQQRGTRGYCPFHSGYDVEIRIGRAQLEHRRLEREEEEEKRKGKKSKGRYLKEVVQGIVYAG